MEGLPEWGIVITGVLAALSLVGTGIAFVSTRRERTARIAGEQAQAELAKKQAKQAEAGAAHHISEAAASTVATILKVKEEVEEELEETRLAMRDMEVRILSLQEHLDVLMAESQACIDENAQLMKRNATLVKENKELLLRIEELILENRRLQEQLDKLEVKLSEVMKHVGLTEEHDQIE